MATYSDNFDSYADALLLKDSANWDQRNGNFEIDNNTGTAGVAICREAGTEICTYCNNTFGNPQWAQITIETANADTYLGPAVRIQSGVNSYYGWYGTTNSSTLFKVISGTWTAFDSTGTGFQSGDVIRLEISGYTFSCYINGVLDSAIGTGGVYTDGGSLLASGYIGMTGYKGGVTGTITSFTGGDLVSYGGFAAKHFKFQTF